MKYLLRTESLSKRFDGVTALDDFSLQVAAGEVVGLVGPNGAGKTTLFNVICGFIPADAGVVQLEGETLTPLRPSEVARLGVGRTFQTLRLIRDATVLDNVLMWFRDQPGEKLRRLFVRPRQWRETERKNSTEAEGILDNLGLGNHLQQPASALSYGQQKLLTLACCLASDAKLLLLDEPVAGIAPSMAQTIIEVIADIRKSGRAILLIEHDMEAVSRVCDRVVFMNLGRLVCQGSFEEVRQNPTVIEAYL